MFDTPKTSVAPASGLPPATATPAATIVNTGQVPAEVYTIRFTDGAPKTNDDGYQRLDLKFEIVAPDKAELPNGNLSIVGGKKGYIYAIVDKGHPRYAEWQAAFQRLGLTDMNGDVDVKGALAAANSGKLFAFAALDSQEKVMRKPKKPDQAVGDPVINPITKKEVTSGWEFTYNGPEKILGVTTAPGQSSPLAGGPF